MRHLHILIGVLASSLLLYGCGNSFTAQNAEVTPGTEYILTIETLDSTRTQKRISDCTLVEGIDVQISWKKSGGDLIASASVTNNNPDYVIKALEGPFVRDMDFDIEDYPLLLPDGLGMMFRKCPTEKVEQTRFNRMRRWLKVTGNEICGPVTKGQYTLKSAYPSNTMSMAYLVFAGKERGISFTSHDEDMKSKTFCVYYNPENDKYSFALNNKFTCFPGQTYQVPETRIHEYKGTWHKAADYYREWHSSVKEPLYQPQWLKEASGWLLAISKQQNDEVMYNYDEYATKLADQTIERGLDIVGLFGWAHGGHDRFYPYYYPDPMRGGEEELIKGIQGLKERGLRVIMYVNGQLIDQNGTDYWEKTGKHVTMVNKNGKYISETWHKYHDAPARTHGRACYRCEEWQKRMLDLAKLIHSYGADGIIYDQLATRTPTYCYSPEHGHSVPAVAVEQDKRKFIETIRREISAIDPEFIVMTEGIEDDELHCINIFHGSSSGVYPPDQKSFEERYDGTAGVTWFPEMVGYTFPELQITLRNPAPVTSRNMSHYVLISHMKNELESRYRADVRYLEENAIPVPEDYGNVRSKPNLDLVTSQNPIAMKTYHRQLSDFQTEYKDLLRLGRFMDVLGFTFEGSHEHACAKAFEYDGKTGIIIWNISEKEPLSWKVNVPGKKLIKVDAPDWKAAEGKPIPPASIALLIYE